MRCALRGVPWTASAELMCFPPCVLASLATASSALAARTSGLSACAAASGARTLPLAAFDAELGGKAAGAAGAANAVTGALFCWRGDKGTLDVPQLAALYVETLGTGRSLLSAVETHAWADAAWVCVANPCCTRLAVPLDNASATLQACFQWQTRAVRIQLLECKQLNA